MRLNIGSFSELAEQVSRTYRSPNSVAVEINVADFLSTERPNRMGSVFQLSSFDLHGRCS